MLEDQHWHDAERRLEDGAQRYESRLAEAEQAHAHAHRVRARGLGWVRNLLLAAVVFVVVIGVLFAAYMLARGTSSEEPPFLRCDPADECITPTESRGP